MTISPRALSEYLSAMRDADADATERASDACDATHCACVATATTTGDWLRCGCGDYADSCVCPTCGGCEGGRCDDYCGCDWLAERAHYADAARARQAWRAARGLRTPAPKAAGSGCGNG